MQLSQKITILLFLNILLVSHSFCQTPYQKDFKQFWSYIDQEYAYWHVKQTDWAKVKAIYQPMVDTVQSRNSFIEVLEKLSYELYDGHTSLSTNLPSSYQLVPSGTDLYVRYEQNKVIVKDVRYGFIAEERGFKIGMEIISIDGKKLKDELTKILPKSIAKPNQEVYDFCANLIVAGTRLAARKMEVNYQGNRQTIELGAPQATATNDRSGPLSHKVLEGNIAYIKIHNSLGNNNLAEKFSEVVDSYASTKSMIIDLRDTPSGGNTTVARAIMGKFISKDMFYQKHNYPYEQKKYGVKRSWMEYVSPKGKIYTKKVIVLVGRWTGSVGEALALGFDEIKNAKVVGTQMAKLLGAIYCYSLDETNIGYCFPAEQLFHVNGTPREGFKPKYLTEHDQDTYDKGLKLAK